MRKGIILAGGTGSRLFPSTLSVSKQLLPVHDKPMIYYGLSVLMLAGIRDILIISSAGELPLFERLFGDGSTLGLSISYAPQDQPKGIAEAFIIGADFIGDDEVALILGDNIIFGYGLAERLVRAAESNRAVIFSYGVKEPELYGVVETDADGKVLSIVEKPENPASNHAVIGLYYYPNDVIDIARNLKPSGRGELEITDVNREYLNRGTLRVEHLSRGYTWMDAGNESDLLKAANFIAAIESRQGLRIACIEEVAWRMGWITSDDLAKLGHKMSNSAYGQYILSLAADKSFESKAH